MKIGLAIVFGTTVLFSFLGLLIGTVSLMLAGLNTLFPFGFPHTVVEIALKVLILLVIFSISTPIFEYLMKGNYKE